MYLPEYIRVFINHIDCIILSDYHAKPPAQISDGQQIPPRSSLFPASKLTGSLMDSSGMIT